MKIALRFLLGLSLLTLLILLLLSRCNMHLPQSDQQGQDGDIRVHMRWDFPGDVDLHVIQPDGEEIYFSNMRSNARGGGELDVDNIEGGPNSQENAFWRRPMEGHYRVFIKYFRKDDEAPNGGPVHVTVKVNGQETPHTVNISREGEEITIQEFDYTAN